MTEINDIQTTLDAVAGYRDRLQGLREIILANTVMCGEIASPTFGEEALIRFVCDRFTEGKLLNISVDESGSASALLPGTSGERTILVAAHADKIWDATVDHTVTVRPESATGPGIGDNSLGIAALLSLPDILETLGLQFESNIILLAATRSLGRGDLEGFRFFLENGKMPIDAAVCLEGMQLGRLSYSCLGMVRGEVTVRTSEQRDWKDWGSSGAIVGINHVIDGLLAIELPEKPRTSIILGSVRAGSAFNVPPTKATLRFEVRSEEPGMVSRVRGQIEDIVAQVNAENNVDARLSILAHRKPGGIPFTHPLVKATRAIMENLDVKPTIAPSTSELSALVEKHIPSLTLGITTGDNKHELDETIQIAPIFTGLAQLIGVLQAIDGGVCND